MSGAVEAFSMTPVMSTLEGIRFNGNACYEGPIFRARFLPPPAVVHGESRRSAAIIDENGGEPATKLSVSVHHQFGVSIEEGTYTFLGEKCLELWLTGHSASTGSFHIVTVLSMSEEEAESLKSLRVLVMKISVFA